MTAAQDTQTRDGTHIVDADVVDAHGTELVPAGGHQPATLFRTDSPSEAMERAVECADVLKTALKAQGLIANIQGREHVTVEGWQTLGGLLGVTAVADGDVDLVSDRHGKPAYRATVKAVTLDGRVVGRASALCSTSEKRWARADDFALISMAQTRATSKALKGPLGFIVKLAGYETTPAEEMQAAVAQAEPHIGPDWAVELQDKIKQAGVKKVGELRALLDSVGLPAGKEEWAGQACLEAIAMLTVPQARKLEAELDTGSGS